LLFVNEYPYLIKYNFCFWTADNPIPGVAGVDYPILSRPPSSPIKPCSSGVGYVADVTSGCQVFTLSIESTPFKFVSFLCAFFYGIV
jgi:hypothetical protein